MIKLTKWRKFAILTSIVVFFVGASTTASWALWSVNATTSGTVNAGTVNLTANGVATTTALATLTTASAAAGTSQTQPVTVANSGNVAETYAATLVSTESPSGAVIGDNVTYNIWVVATASACTSAAAVGTGSLTGTLNTTTGKALFTGHALAVGASEVLCVRTGMAASPPVAIIGQSLSASITFTGTSS